MDRPNLLFRAAAVAAVVVTACGGGDDASSAQPDAGTSGGDGGVTGSDGGPGADAAGADTVVKDPSGVATLRLPPGAVPEGTDVKLRVVPYSELPQDVKDTRPLGDVVVEVLPEGLVLGEHAELRIHVADTSGGWLNQAGGFVTYSGVRGRTRDAAGAITPTPNASVLWDAKTKEADVVFELAHFSWKWGAMIADGGSFSLSADLGADEQGVGEPWKGYAAVGNYTTKPVTDGGLSIYGGLDAKLMSTVETLDTDADWKVSTGSIPIAPASSTTVELGSVAKGLPEWRCVTPVEGQVAVYFDTGRSTKAPPSDSTGGISRDVYGRTGIGVSQKIQCVAADSSLDAFATAYAAAYCSEAERCSFDSYGGKAACEKAVHDDTITSGTGCLFHSPVADDCLAAIDALSKQACGTAYPTLGQMPDACSQASTDCPK